MSADTSTLEAQKREGTGKGVARKLREAGRVPAVLYGRELDSMHISIDSHEAFHLFHSISVDNTIIDLSVEGEKESFQTLVREIQMHPFKPSILHVDFLRIQKGVKIDVDIPVNVLGTAKGVRVGGGIVELIIHDLSVRCVPSKIPETIDVDITELDIGESVHVSDLVVDEDFEILADPVRTIVTISAPRAEEVAEDDEEMEEGLEGEAPDPEAVDEEG